MTRRPPPHPPSQDAGLGTAAPFCPQLGDTARDTAHDGRPGVRTAHAMMSFDARPRHVETARRVTAAVLVEAGVGDHDAIRTVQLLVSEIVTNAIVHGDGDPVSFQVTCDSTGEVLIEVDDHSPGVPEVREAGPEDEGGRGLRLVTYFAREWGRRGTRTWCTVLVGPGAG